MRKVVEIFDEVLAEIELNKQLKDSGKQIGIPYPFETLNFDLGGIEKECVIGVTANSGISKSKFTRFVFIYSVYKFYKQTNYPVKILYFPLEDSDKDIMYNMICYYLKDRYDMIISVQVLRQMGKFSLDTYTLAKIREARGYFADLGNILDVIDDAPTVTEIGNKCKLWAHRNGIIKTKDLDDGTKEITGYEDKTGIHTIVIVDNLSNIIPEKRHINKHQAIGELAALLSRNILAKFFKFTVVLVQQQSQAKEKIQMTQSGKHMYEKYEPSLGDLAENLEVQRSLHLAFGIFSPDRYGLDSYWGYDIEVLGSFFRSIKILKSNRSGTTDKIIPLWFEGSNEHYELLPLPPNAKNPSVSKELELYYRKAYDIRNKKNNHQLKINE